jgi:predicted ATPase
MPNFARLNLSGWRQFHAVDIDLSAPVTVLTGSNGCGKTSILTILSQHFGWNIHFVSTPFDQKSTGRRLYSEVRRMRRIPSGSSVSADVSVDFDDGVPPDQGAHRVGELSYSDGNTCTLHSQAKVSTGAQYQIQYSQIRSVQGIYIPSHRPATFYQAVSTIPATPKTTAQQYSEYQQFLQQVYQGSRGNNNPGTAMKQSLIALALFGYGNQVVVANAEYRSLFESFQGVLQEILPTTLGFQRLEIRVPEVVLVTDSGEFSLDAMSGGVNALFTIAWQIQMAGWGKAECTVLIDEPENHLHPSMQRSLIPSLSRAFPDYRFIVATHSPFIVASNPAAKVYALTHNAERLVESSLLDAANLAASPDAILRDVLDVPSLMPIWAERELRRIIQEHQHNASDPAAVDELFRKLKTLGLASGLSHVTQEK